VANPFSILTKGALILRDLDLLQEAARATDVSAALSIGSVDRELRGKVEPGAPPPARRLDVVRQLNEAGIRSGVLMAPILPFLSDSDEQLEATVEAIAAAGAAYVSPIVLHLRPGAREWWQAWLRREHPHLLPRYAELYGERAYAPKAYQRDVSERVHALAARHKVGRRRTLRGGDQVRSPAPKSRAAPADTTPRSRPEQLSML
jgi:DNA repair photolyase